MGKNYSTLLSMALCVLPCSALASASSEVSIAGIYEILICKEACSFADQESVVVKGQVVLFATKLEQHDLDRFDKNRFMYHFGEPINGCYQLEKVRDNTSYAGLKKVGITSWSQQGDEFRFQLFRSPDAGYQATVKRTKDGLAGTGVSWGVGMGAPQHRTTETLVARRTGDADISKCTFQTPEEAELRRQLADPARSDILALEKTYRDTLLTTLQASSSPRDWAMAGWLLGAEKGDTSILRARQAAPDDRLIQWIAVVRTISYAVPVMLNPVAQGTMIHDKELDASALTQLQQAEPDNAAPWLMALRDAVDQNDDTSIDLAMSHLAGAVRYDDHAAELLKAQLEIFRSHPLADNFFAAVARLDPACDMHGAFTKSAAPYFDNEYPFAHANLSWRFLSPYNAGMHQLYVVCTQTPDRSATRTKQCIAAARVLAINSRRYEFRSQSAMLLNDMSLFDNDDIRSARADGWLAAQNNAIQANPEAKDRPRVDEAMAFIDEWIATGDELEAMRRAVVRAGLSLVPPADWTLGPLFKNFEGATQRMKTNSAH